MVRRMPNGIGPREERHIQKVPPKRLQRTLEAHLHRFACCGIRSIELEKIHLLKVERVGDKIAWKGLYGRRKILHIRVIEATSGLNLVFRIAEFLLKLKEICIRLEVWVRL